MRIALVITELDPGGAEKCLTQLACFLAVKGHAVEVFAIGPPPLAGQDSFLLELQAHNVPITFGISPGRSRSMRSFLKVVFWLRSELRRFNPEVIQSMLFHGNLLAALAAELKRTKVFGGVRVRQPERWRWWLERWASRRMLKMVCVSEDVARHCETIERIPREKIVTIPNGIDLQSVSRAIDSGANLQWTEFGLPSNARILMFVGRLHPQKGIEELVTRADALLSSLPNHHLVLFGNGPLETKLKALAKERVHILGWQANVLPWMHRAEVLLLPASYEGMPNVLLEAMSVGLPFIAFDVDGVRQLLGKSEFVANQIAVPGDFEQFIDLTRQMALDSSLRSNCASRNFAQIEKHFQLEKQLAAYVDMYNATS